MDQKDLAMKQMMFELRAAKMEINHLAAQLTQTHMAMAQMAVRITELQTELSRRRT